MNDKDNEAAHKYCTEVDCNDLTGNPDALMHNIRFMAFLSGVSYAREIPDRELLGRMFWFARGYELTGMRATTDQIVDEFLEVYNARIP